jgi:hypothetical protein
MPSRFPPGVTAYAKDGQRYIVEEVVRGVVYCHSDAGAEVEFAEALMTTEAEWLTQSGNRRDLLYARLRQSPLYAPYKGAMDKVAAEQLLARAASLLPGILDFVAMDTANRALVLSGNRSKPELSITKCREAFDAAPAQTRAYLLATLVGAAPDMLVSAAKIGDNLLRAMITKGLDAAQFDDFGSRRRQ